MKNILLIVWVVFFAFVLKAQEAPKEMKKSNSKMESKEKGKRPDATQRATRLTEKMTQKLLLSEAQKKDVYQVNLNKAQKIDELLAQHGKEKKGLGEKRKVIEQERDAEFKRIFSTVQYEKWVKWKAEKKQKMKEKKIKHKQGGPNKGKQEDENDDITNEIDQMEE